MRQNASREAVAKDRRSNTGEGRTVRKKRRSKWARSTVDRARLKDRTVPAADREHHRAKEPATRPKERTQQAKSPSTRDTRKETATASKGKKKAEQTQGRPWQAKDGKEAKIKATEKNKEEKREDERNVE